MSRPRVLVTGGAGFVGSHVVDELMARGARVRVVDDLSTGRERNVHPGADVVIDDMGAVRIEEPVVIHCAATADISRNWDSTNPNRSEIFQNNVAGTVRLLENARASGVKAFIFLSTLAVHSKHDSPYVASKIAGEAFLQAYALNSFRAVVFHLPSCVGERYSHGHLADFVAQAQSDEHVIRAKTYGSEERPFANVRNVARHIAVQALTALDKSETTLCIPPYEQWSARRSVDRMTRLNPAPFQVIWGEEDSGWPGDPVGLGDKFSLSKRAESDDPIELGVDEALRSLGWAAYER